MSSFKPIDGSKEDFRKYLDRKGVLDAITKVLIKCNSDRPENAIEYLLDNLGERLKDKDTIMRLESELNDARNEIEVLKRELNGLKLNAFPRSDASSAELPPEDSVQESAVDSATEQINNSSSSAEKSTIKTDMTKEPSESAVTDAKTPEDAELDTKESAQ